MSATEDEIRQLYQMWQEAKEVSLVLQQSWAALVQGRRLFMASAIKAEIPVPAAEKLYAELVDAAHKEHADAFKRMCELADEHTAAKLAIPVGS